MEITMELDQNASGTPETLISDDVPTPKKDTVSYDQHRKLLGEKKKTQAQLLEMQERLKSYEDKELETTGQKDELIASLRSRAEETESKYANAEKAFAWRQLNSALTNKAKEMGCVAPDKLIRLLDDNDINAIELDGGYMVNSQDVDAVLGRAREENGFLFKQRQVNVVDGLPKTVEHAGPKKLSDMSYEEKKQALLQAKLRGE